MIVGGSQNWSRRKKKGEKARRGIRARRVVCVVDIYSRPNRQTMTALVVIERARTLFPSQRKRVIQGGDPTKGERDRGERGTFSQRTRAQDKGGRPRDRGGGVASNGEPRQRDRGVVRWWPPFGDGPEMQDFAAEGGAPAGWCCCGALIGRCGLGVAVSSHSMQPQQ